MEEFKLDEAANLETQIYYSDFTKVDGITTANHNYKLGFLKALELVAREINSKQQTTIYSKEVLDFIEGLKG